MLFNIAPGRRRSWRSRLVAPAGFPPLAVPSEVVTGSALVGGTVLFRWPTDGRVRGKVARRSGAADLSHLVRRGRLWAAARRRSTRSSTPPPAGPRAAGRSSARPLVVLQRTTVIGLRPPIDVLGQCIGSGRSRDILPMETIEASAGFENSHHDTVLPAHSGLRPPLTT